jgi:hypothetical protein
MCGVRFKRMAHVVLRMKRLTTLSSKPIRVNILLEFKLEVER